MKQTLFIKLMLIFFFILISMNNFAQKINFKLVNNYDISINKVYIGSFAKDDYYKNTTTKDSAIIVNGKFSFNIINRTEIPHPYYLKFSNGVVSNEFFIEKFNNDFVLDNIDYEVVPKPASMTKTSIDNDEFESSYKSIKKEFRQKYDSLNETVIKNQKTEKQISYLTKLRKNYSNDYHLNFLNFVKNHPNSYFCFWELVGMLRGGGYDSIYENIFNYFSIEIKNSYESKIFFIDLMEAKKNDLNNSFSPIVLKNEKQEELIFNVKSLNAKYILIDFWFSYCAPCILQFKNFKPIYSKYKNKGFEIVGISTDKKKDVNNWKNTTIKNDIQWLQFIDIDGKESKIKSINQFPTNYLLDGNGKILKKDITSEELEKFLQENLK